MDDIPNCAKLKHTRPERSRYSLRRKKYRPVSGRKRRYSPIGCDNYSREDLRLSAKTFTLGPPYAWPCQDRCCYPEPTECGLLNTIRSSIIKIFTGRKANQLYAYSMSQLKFMEQLLDKLEKETCCLEGTIRQAVECECNIDCNSVRCTLDIILDRVEGVKCDLECARECYDPSRDRCEFELICCLMERAWGLESLLQELCFRLECVGAPLPKCDACCGGGRGTHRTKQRCCGSWRGSCTPRAAGDTVCRAMCFDKSKCCEAMNLGKIKNVGLCHSKGLCRTSSVIPVGVMLVKL